MNNSVTEMLASRVLQICKASRQDTVCCLCGDTHVSCLNLTVSDRLAQSVTTYFFSPDSQFYLHESLLIARLQEYR
jgi:hypothetical protein